MRLYAMLMLSLAACGGEPIHQPSDIPAPLKAGQEVDSCSCNPQPFTTDGTVQDVNCQYGWKVIVSDCDGVCTNGAPQWRTLCGPLSI